MDAAVDMQLTEAVGASAILEQFSSWTDSQQLELVKNLMHKLKHKGQSIILQDLKQILCRDFIVILPSEITEKILSYLSPAMLCVVEQVCQTWRQVVADKDAVLWKRQLEYNVRNCTLWEDVYSRYIRRTLPAVPYGVDPPTAGGSWKSMYKQCNGFAARVQTNWQNGHCHESVIRDASRKTLPNTPPQADGVGQGIYCIQFDTAKIMSGGRDHRLKQWNIVTHDLEQEFVGHTGSVLCLQFDEHKVISGSSDTNIIVWDLATGKHVQVLRDHEQSVLHLNFNDDRLVSCSKDKLIIVWRWDGYEFVKEHTLIGHKAAVNVVEFDRRYIVSASGDRTIRIWHTDTGQELAELKGHERGIACLQYHDNYIVSGSSDKTLKVWEIHLPPDGALPGSAEEAAAYSDRHHELLRTLKGHTDLVRCVRFDVGMDRIVSGSYDHTMICWSFHTGRALFRIGTADPARQVLIPETQPEGHTNRVFRVQFDGVKIISSSQDDTIRVWDMAAEGVVEAGEAGMLGIEASGGGGGSLPPTYAMLNGGSLT